MLDTSGTNLLINQSFSKEDLTTAFKMLLLTSQTISTMLLIQLLYKFL